MSSSFIAWFKKWNRRIHYHLGLFTLLFLWIFALSGLFLNHPDWFKPDANRSEFTKSVRFPQAGDDVTVAKAILDQLGMSGEIVWNPGKPVEGHLRFRLVRFDSLSGVDADLKTSQVTVRTNRWNIWKSLSNIHTFTGVRRVWREAQWGRDWVMTWIWSISIDAIAVALIVMVLTSYYMTYQLRPKRTWGLIALGLGVIVCFFFLWGHTLLAG